MHTHILIVTKSSFPVLVAALSSQPGQTRRRVISLPHFRTFPNARPSLSSIDRQCVNTRIDAVCDLSIDRTRAIARSHSIAFDRLFIRRAAIARTIARIAAIARE